MQDIIISAKEAKQKTDKIYENCATEELIKIMALIDEASSLGRYSISYDKSMEYYTSKRLKELGYKIQQHNEFNKLYYSINWKNAN